MSKKLRNELSQRKLISQSSCLQNLDNHKLRTSEIFLAILIGLLFFFIYLSTLYPGSAGGDSGELIVAAKTMGIVHPPGYPLFTLIGKLFTFIPWGSVAQRVHAVSAFFDAGACTFIFLILLCWTSHASAALLGAGLFGFSPLVWTHASAAEVFGLNNFFAASLLYFCLRYEQTQNHKWVYFSAFWLGLGLTNHHTLVFYGFPVAFWMLYKTPRRFCSIKTMATLLILLIAGLLPYLYLPLASHFIPLMGWGDQTHLTGFLTHLLRAEYGTFQLRSDQTGHEDWLFFTQMGTYLKSIPFEFLFFGVLLIGLGFLFSMKRQNRSSFAQLVCFVFFFYTLGFAYLSGDQLNDELSRNIHARFYQLSNLILCLWAGLGGCYVSQKLKLFPKKLDLFTAAALVLLQMAIHYRQQDQSKNKIFDDFGKVTLANLPKDSLLFTNGDYIIGPIRYLQTIEQFRADVKVIQFGLLSYPWSKRWANANFPDLVIPKKEMYVAKGYTMREFLELNLSKQAIFVINGYEAWDTSLKELYQNWPWGLSWRVVPSHDPLPFEVWESASQSAFSQVKLPEIQKYEDGTWEYYVQATYWMDYQYYASYVLKTAFDLQDDPRWIQKGIDGLEKASHFKLIEKDADLYKNLGLGYQHLIQKSPTAEVGMLKAWKHYLSLVTQENSETQLIRQIVSKSEKVQNK